MPHTEDGPRTDPGKPGDEVSRKATQHRKRPQGRGEKKECLYVFLFYRAGTASSQGSLQTGSSHGGKHRKCGSLPSSRPPGRRQVAALTNSCCARFPVYARSASKQTEDMMRAKTTKELVNLTQYGETHAIKDAALTELKLRDAAAVKDRKAERLDFKSAGATWRR
jgi:hypothetical protein